MRARRGADARERLSPLPPRFARRPCFAGEAKIPDGRKLSIPPTFKPFGALGAVDSWLVVAYSEAYAFTYDRSYYRIHAQALLKDADRLARQLGFPVAVRSSWRLCGRFWPDLIPRRGRVVGRLLRCASQGEVAEERAMVRAFRRSRRRLDLDREARMSGSARVSSLGQLGQASPVVGGFSDKFNARRIRDRGPRSTRCDRWSPT